MVYKIRLQGKAEAQISVGKMLGGECVGQDREEIPKWMASISVWIDNSDAKTF